MALPMCESFPDPIHGAISVTAWELEIMNCQLVRRLQGIRQLGLDYLVFPGANHTRFEHSLGVMHIAHFIGEKLQLPDSRLVVLRLAALLHDLGHGPFSHFFEELLARFELSIRHEDLGERMLESEEMIEAFEEAEKCIPKNIWPGVSTELCLKAEVIRLLNESHRKRYDKRLEAQILGSELDADRIDYLARDPHYLGMKYGEIDVTRLVFDGLRSIKDRIVLTETGVKIAELLLLARSHVLADVSLSPDCRLLNAKLWRLAEKAKDCADELCSFKDASKNPAKILRTYDDYSFLTSLLESGDLDTEDKRFLEYLLFGSTQWLQRYRVESLAWSELHPNIQPLLLRVSAKDRARWERSIEKEIQKRAAGLLTSRGIYQVDFEIVVDIPELRGLDMSEAIVYSDKDVLYHPKEQRWPQEAPEVKYERLDQYSEVVPLLFTVLRNQWRLRIYYAADRVEVLSDIRYAILQYCEASLWNRGHGEAVRHFQQEIQEG